MPPSTGTELNSFTIPKSTNPVKGKSLVAKSELRPSNQGAPQDNVLTIRTVEGPTGANGHTIMVTWPLCGSEAVGERCRPDVHKLSGQSSSRRYLRFWVDGARRTMDKLLQAEKDLEWFLFDEHWRDHDGCEFILQVPT